MLGKVSLVLILIAAPLIGQAQVTNDNSVDFALTDFQITTDWAEYTKTFDAGATDVKFEIWVSGTDVTVWLDFVYMYEGDYVEGIMPSEISSKPVESAGKLAGQWSKLKTQQ